MIGLLRIKRLRSSILGLAIDGSRIEGVVLRRTNGSLRVQKSFTASLALNPLTGDPELVGREIRNHLEQAGVRERRCAVCIPLSWALVMHTTLPELREAGCRDHVHARGNRRRLYGRRVPALSDP